MSIRLFSWNVNGFRAVLGKGFGDWLTGAAPDVLGLQEVKAEEGQIGEARHFPGYACTFEQKTVSPEEFGKLFNEEN